jgi:hypothetical protein
MVRSIAMWSATLFVAATGACGGSTEQELVTPTAGDRCQMSLSVPATVPSAGAQVVVPFTAARDCVWSARPTAPWLDVQPVVGQGSTALTLTVGENPLGRQRSASLDINGQSFAVLQEAAPCWFQVQPAEVAVPHQGGRATVQLSTREGCAWTTSSSQPWLRVVTGSGGESSGALELAVDANTGAERSALLSVATLLVEVSQQANPNDRSSCRFSLGPGSRVIAAAGGTGSFTVSVQAGCAWTVASSQPWVTIVSSLNPIGPGEVVYRVDPNPLPTTRSAAIAAGPRRHVVTQEAAPRP